MAEKMQEESKYPFIDQKELEGVESYIKQNGLENIADFMTNKIKEAENVSVKIGVTGMAGTGKSTFINTFRGLTAEDDGAAAVSAVESGATLVPEEYHHPRNKNITLWDLPGIGTSNFNEGNYEEKVNFGSYDFFLIFIGNRIFEHDEWLAKRAKLRRKKYFIVRTRIDEDIKSDKLNRPKTHDVEQLLTKIRDETKMLLEAKGVYPEGGIYLISALLDYVNQWDYGKLEHDMLYELPREKREVLTLSLNNISEDLIKAKCDILRSRVWKKAIFLVAQGFVPSAIKKVMPQKVIDYFNREMTSYRDVLGLDDDSLRRLSQRTGIERESLNSMATEEVKIQITELALPSVMGVLTTPNKPKLPVVAFLVKLGEEYVEAFNSLHNILDRLELTALHVLHFVFHPT